MNELKFLKLSHSFQNFIFYTCSDFIKFSRFFRGKSGEKFGFKFFLKIIYWNFTYAMFY